MGVAGCYPNTWFGIAALCSLKRCTASHGRFPQGACFSDQRKSVLYQLLSRINEPGTKWEPSGARSY